MGYTLVIYIYKEIGTFPIIQEAKEYLRHLLGRYGTSNNRDSENRDCIVLSYRTVHHKSQSIELSILHSLRQFDTVHSLRHSCVCVCVKFR